MFAIDEDAVLRDAFLDEHPRVLWVGLSEKEINANAFAVFRSDAALILLMFFGCAHVGVMVCLAIRLLGSAVAATRR